MQMSRSIGSIYRDTTPLSTGTLLVFMLFCTRALCIYCLVGGKKNALRQCWEMSKLGSAGCHKWKTFKNQNLNRPTSRSHELCLLQTCVIKWWLDQIPEELLPVVCSVIYGPLEAFSPLLHSMLHRKVRGEESAADQKLSSECIQSYSDLWMRKWEDVSQHLLKQHEIGLKRGELWRRSFWFLRSKITQKAKYWRKCFQLESKFV